MKKRKDEKMITIKLSESEYGALDDHIYAGNDAIGGDILNAYAEVVGDAKFLKSALRKWDKAGKPI